MSWKRITFRDVLVFTLPPLLFVLYLFGTACLDSHRVSQYDDWWSSEHVGVGHMLRMRLKLAGNAFVAGARRNRLSAEDETLEAIRLQLDRGKWSAMTSDVAEHWGEWTDALLDDDGELREVGVRLRGDATAHWTTPKKSLSIRMKRGELYGGLRRLNLSVKLVLPQHVVSALAADVGLLVPRSDVLPVFVNGSFHGINHLFARPDESLLRLAGRMPGNVYRGEALMPGDAFDDLPNELFLDPHLWDRTAENERPGATGDRALFDWIADVSSSTFEGHERLMARMDTDELARLLALMLLCGDPFHMSASHNQYWYEDPSAGTLHPIVWDLTIRPLGAPLPGSSIHRLWNAVLRDPRVFDRALELTVEWSEDGWFVERATELASSADDAYPNAFAFDRARAGVIPVVKSPEYVSNVVRSNVSVVTGWAEDG
jgi:hypothetical protein